MSENFRQCAAPLVVNLSVMGELPMLSFFSPFIPLKRSSDIRPMWEKMSLML